MFRQATSFPIDTDIVVGCLDGLDPRDQLFLRALNSGIRTLSPCERAVVAPVTGHVAESVVELMLDGLGWHVLWHFAGPGLHGVDLVFLTADNRVVAVEVKGTLVSGRMARLSRREVEQMTAAWLDDPANPGMAELGLDSADVYGAVVVVNFADLIWRCALTADFAVLHPVGTLDQLADLTWLT